MIILKKLKVIKSFLILINFSKAVIKFYCFKLNFNIFLYLCIMLDYTKNINIDKINLNFN